MSPEPRRKGVLWGGTPRYLPVMAGWWEPPGLCLCRRSVLSHEQRLRACLLRRQGSSALQDAHPRTQGKDAPSFRTRGRQPGYPCSWDAEHSAADPNPRCLPEAPVPSRSVSKGHQRGHSRHSHTCPDLPKSQGPSIFHPRTTEALRQVSSECILY